MTATLHALGAGREAGNYYTQDPNREARPHARDEYYSQDGGGVWWSSGETIVHTGADIDRDTFRDLCAGLDPATGDRHGRANGLVRGAGEKHRAGWDLTLSSPKTVGLLWAAGDEDQRALIREAHGQAVEATLRFIEREGLLAVRLGAGGAVQERPTDLLVARYDHFTSREGDPELHTHCVLLNVAGSRDGRYRTLEPRDLYRWTKVVGGYYRTHLATHLRDHGLEAREAGRGQFEIAGIPQTLIERFSKRSQQIEAIVEDRGTASGRQKELANLRSRQGKEAVPTGDLLEARWRTELAEAGVDVWAAARDPHARGREGLEAPQMAPDLYSSRPEIAGNGGAVARASSTVFAHESVVDRRTVLEGAYGLAPVTRQNATEIEAELAGLEADGRLQSLTPDELRERVWTTPDIAKAEAAMLRAADRPDERDWITPQAVEAAIEGASVLSKEQAEAIRVVARRDGVALLEAGAGTGKTTAARVLVDAARQSNLDVVGLAPSWVAADELGTSTGIETRAITKWRHDTDRGHEGPWGERTLVLVDEAGMVGTRDLSAILTRAEKAGAQVVLIGDRGQLEAVPGGGALRAVAERLEGQATIQEVRRQNIDWQRSASKMMSRGDVAAGLQAYLQRGAIELVAGQDATLARTVAAWTEMRARHGQDVGIVTRRNVDAAALNKRARQVLRAEKRLTGQDVRLPSVDRQGRVTEIDLGVGDRMRFGASLPRHGVRNGARGEVTGIGRGKDPIVRLKLDDGRTLEESWSAFGREVRGKTTPPRVTHGYAGTTHSYQGRTMPAAVLSITSRTDSREVYVGMTRHTDEVCVVAEKNRLEAEAMRPNSLPPTEMQIGQQLLTEAATIREKANVIDYVANPPEFVATGEVQVRPGRHRPTLRDLTQAALRMAAAFVRDEGQPRMLFGLSQVRDRRALRSRVIATTIQRRLSTQHPSITEGIDIDR